MAEDLRSDLAAILLRCPPKEILNDSNEEPTHEGHPKVDSRAQVSET